METILYNFCEYIVDHNSKHEWTIMIKFKSKACYKVMSLVLLRDKLTRK